MTIPPAKQPKRKALVGKKNQDTSPLGLLKDVYSLIRSDLNRYMTLNALSESQSRVMRDHGRFLIEATREVRLAEKENRDWWKDMKDHELRAIALELISVLPIEELEEHIKERKNDRSGAD